MRDHFDPLAPLLHQNQNQNQHQPNPYHGNHVQGQMHHQQPSKAVRSLVHNPFGNGFSNTAGFSTVAPAGSIHGSVGEKRNNSDENVDCNLLQSSLKRVRLSRSPGEFRLQRDLKTLDAMKWGSSHVAPNALNFAATTWIHRSSGARLTMVDSLRICMFLPMTATYQNIQNSTGVDPQQQYQHQLHSYHRDYRWRIMVQIPRMYPHNPPVVTRVEGLSVEGIAINEAHPNSRNGKRKNENDGASSVHSTPGVTTSESLFFTEAQLARSPSSGTMTSTGTNTTSKLSTVSGIGKTIEWNRWSPITELGELLDFLLGTALSNLSTTTMNTTTRATPTALADTNDHFEQSMAVTTARMSSSSSSSLSSVSSASSISSWSNRNYYKGGNNIVAETMMSDENATTSSNKTNVSGLSFLPPNRFDLGYGKSGVGQRLAGTPGTTPRTTNTSAWLQYREKQQGEDDVGMDMS